MVLHGHKHFFNRHHPLYKGVVDPNGLDNPKAPLYIVNGAAGHWQGNGALCDTFIVLHLITCWQFFDASILQTYWKRQFLTTSLSLSMTCSDGLVSLSWIEWVSHTLLLLSHSSKLTRFLIPRKDAYATWIRRFEEQHCPGFSYSIQGASRQYYIRLPLEWYSSFSSASQSCPPSAGEGKDEHQISFQLVTIWWFVLRSKISWINLFFRKVYSLFITFLFLNWTTNQNWQCHPKNGVIISHRWSWCPTKYPTMISLNLRQNRSRIRQNRSRTRCTKSLHKKNSHMALQSADLPTCTHNMHQNLYPKRQSPVTLPFFRSKVNHLIGRFPSIQNPSSSGRKHSSRATRVMKEILKSRQLWWHRRLNLQSHDPVGPISSVLMTKIWKRWRSKVYSSRSHQWYEGRRGLTSQTCRCNCALTPVDYLHQGWDVWVE